MNALAPAGPKSLQPRVLGPASGGPAASTTLGRLRALRLVLLLLLVVWAGIGIVTSLQTRTAMATAQKRFIPEVAAAQEIKLSVAAMDAAIAGQLSRPAAAKGEQADAAEASRGGVVRALMDAAETGSADRESLTSVETALGTYGRLMQRVRDLRDRGEPAQWAVYRQATAVVDEQLQPRAEAMEDAGDQHVAELVQQLDRRSAKTDAAFACLGLLLFAVLVVAQVFLSRRTRRTLNPGLLAASVLCLAATGYSLQSEARAQGTFRRALVEAYPAAHAGWQAASAAALARDMEARASLDPNGAASYAEAAGRQRDAVATLPVTLTGEQLVAALREGRSVDGFSGYLAKEWQAAHTAGEREAVTRALAAWLPSGAAASKSPASNNGKADKGPAPFERALRMAVQAHERALDQAAGAELHEQTRLELSLGAFALAFMALILAGLAPRIREYK